MDANILQECKKKYKGNGLRNSAQFQKCLLSPPENYFMIKDAFLHKNQLAIRLRKDEQSVKNWILEPESDFIF